MKRLLIFFSLFFVLFCTRAQAYHSDDKEGLRIFLRQNENFKKIGIEEVDTLSWQDSEWWVAIAKGLTWNNSSPKRLKKINWCNYKLKGDLNCNKWEELVHANFEMNFIFSLILNKNSNLTFLTCCNNKISSLDINNNPLLTNLDCSQNQLISLGLSKNMNLSVLKCFNNKLTSFRAKSLKLA